MSLLYLNVGSGQRKFGAPFTNIDLNPRWEPDLVADCASLPYLNNSCALICSHHQIEHVELTHADAMLREWHRLLAPGGSLIICCPDLRALANAWLEGRIDDYIYCVNLYGAYMGNEADIHRWGYTKRSLTAKLNAAAVWREVKPFNFRPLPGADIAKDFWILGTEAIK